MSNDSASPGDAQHANRAATAPQQRGFEAANAFLEGSRAMGNGIELEFSFELTQARKTGPIGLQVAQKGRLIVGAGDSRRLDVFLEGHETPIVCALRASDAWMVWGQEPLLTRSAAGNRAARSWGGQLQAQTSQMSSWTETLLPSLRARSEHWRLLRAVELADGAVQFSVDASTRYGQRELLVDAARATDGGPVVVSRIVDRQTGRLVEYSAYAQVDDECWLAFKVHSVEFGGSGETYDSTWFVTAAQENASGTATDAKCAVPERGSSEFRHLLGERVINADGAESVQIW